MSLVKTNGYKVLAKSTSGAAGKGMTVAGAGGLGLWFLAGLLPLVSLPVLCVILVVTGLFFWE